MTFKLNLLNNSKSLLLFWSFGGGGRCHYSTTKNLFAKQVANAEEAIKNVPDGARLMVGGFGLCGIPENSIRALANLKKQRLTIISNNGGIDDRGIGLLLLNKQVKRIIGSYVGEN